ncbi:MAG: hypothetical protein ACKVT1_06630 [Dehalococcoidia bacterium]
MKTRTFASSWRDATIPAVAAIALVLTAACGGGGDEKTLDVEKADALAHEALLVAGDLSGNGWEVDADDNFEDSPFAETKACADLSARRDEARKKSDPERAGRAKRDFSRAGTNTPTQVEIEFEIFDTADTPTESLRLQRAAFDANLRECFSDTFKDGADPSLTIEVKESGTLGKLPSEGVAKALDVHIADDKEALDLRLETYGWRYLNGSVSVSISGDKEDITAALVKSTIDAVQAKLDKLVE